MIPVSYRVHSSIFAIPIQYERTGLAAHVIVHCCLSFLQRGDRSDPWHSWCYRGGGGGRCRQPVIVVCHCRDRVARYRLSARQLQR